MHRLCIPLPTAQDALPFSSPDSGPFPPASPVAVAVRKTVYNLLRRGVCPAALGGDDSIPIPFLEAFQHHGPLTLVQIDAHLDWKDAVNCERHGYSGTMRRASEMPWIQHIVQVGMRGVGSAGEEELAAAREWGTRIVTAHEVLRGGSGLVLDAVPTDMPCIITLDCDGLDPGPMPAVRAPLPGGLDYHSILGIIHGIARKTTLLAFDLVEFTPQTTSEPLALLLRCASYSTPSGPWPAPGFLRSRQDCLFFIPLFSCQPRQLRPASVSAAR